MPLLVLGAFIGAIFGSVVIPIFGLESYLIYKFIVISMAGFFAATVGVALYSDIGLISELCMLLARGALISMVIVVTVLPSMFMLFDKVICRTSAGFLPKGERNKSSRRKFRTA